ncbi:MAG: hypothetical protein E6833_18580 [Bradyrhizobium sp.]|nr:hypothetical protein [Bradyrhizobium sp.]
MRLVAGHPSFELVYAAGEGSAGQRLAERFPGVPAKLADLVIEKWDPARLPSLDVLFASLPTGASRDALARVPDDVKIVDIGGEAAGLVQHRTAARDGIHQRCRSDFEPRHRLLDCGGHRLDLIGGAVAVALGHRLRQTALGENDLLVAFRDGGPQCLGLEFDRLHLGLGAIELAVARTGLCEPLGGHALFFQRLFGAAQPLRQPLSRGLFVPQGALEDLDGAELTLEKDHGDNPWTILRRKARRRLGRRGESTAESCWRSHAGKLGRKPG